MKLRELRNNLVFWLSLAGSAYVFRDRLGYGWPLTIPCAMVAAIVAVVLVALLTDRLVG